MTTFLIERNTVISRINGGIIAASATKSNRYRSLFAAGVRDVDLVRHARDGDAQPLLRLERRVGIDHPRPACRLLDGEKLRRAGERAFDLALQTHGGKHVGQEHRLPAVEDVLLLLIGELHGVEREAAGLRCDRLALLLHDVQLLCALRLDSLRHQTMRL